ncbi:nitroreductase family protein [Gordonia sp. SL306]|uniref:nitroreductase family protein n=1 Tax=Gordonia sp. SL306 TaxID=2995145 RepID=UPI0022700722|nr:nitroreductase family protein [Gordonia sp. SL306]WAC57399.1 nitroreductase family protein [Gordonia sp. SL306]
MHELIEGRWSARGYDPDATISTDDVTSILEAGRWAPTWGRVQPVRFVVGIRGDATFMKLTDVLTSGNVGWAPASAALVLVCTAAEPDDEKARTYATVDTGLAVAQMILQAADLGFNGHPMAGFDPARVRELFAIPDDRRPLVLLGVGKLADPATLAPEIRERDERPRTRLPLDEVAFSETWGHAFGSP